MTVNDAKGAFDKIKEEGGSDNDILAFLLYTFIKGDITKDELNGLVNVLGYHFTPEFDALNEEDAKKEGAGYAIKGEVPSDEEVEKAKNGGEAPSEKKPEDKEDDSEDDEEKKKPKKKEDEDGEDEEEKAMKLFG